MAANRDILKTAAIHKVWAVDDELDTTDSDLVELLVDRSSTGVIGALVGLEVFAEGDVLVSISSSVAVVPSSLATGIKILGVLAFVGLLDGINVLTSVVLGVADVVSVLTVFEGLDDTSSVGLSVAEFNEEKSLDGEVVSSSTTGVGGSVTGTRLEERMGRSVGDVVGLGVAFVGAAVCLFVGDIVVGFGVAFVGAAVCLFVGDIVGTVVCSVGTAVGASVLTSSVSWPLLSLLSSPWRTLSPST